MGIGIAREDFIANEILNEIHSPPACGVIGVGHPARAERTPHHLIVTDDASPDPAQQRGGRQVGSFRGDCHLPRLRARCHNDTMVTASIAPMEVQQEAPEVDRPWITIVWNDPINLMSYVTYVFMTYFKYDKAKAERLMLDVHEKGRAVVSNGTREEMERDVAAMHGYGLWATVSKDD